ncbi:hypothetical protein P4S72_19205 [Vibrio sp. PP-XX7]
MSPYTQKIRPNSVAVMDLTFGRTWTYQQFDNVVNRLSAFLIAKGVSAGIGLRALQKIVLKFQHYSLLAQGLALSLCR